MLCVVFSELPVGGRIYMGGDYINFAGQRRIFFAAADAVTGTLDLQWDPSGSSEKLSPAYTTWGFGTWFRTSHAGDYTRGQLS